jgi:ATP/ADP translocase
MNEMQQLFGKVGASILVAVIVGSFCIPKHGWWICLFVVLCIMVAGAVVRQMFYPE